MKLVFLGPPGAGKGTLASDASKKLELPHISTGEIFRQAVRDGTRLGQMVKTILDSGDLVPDDLTIELVKERLTKPDALGGWILDGFPRTIGQSEELEKMNPPDYVINFDIEDAKVIERLAGRRCCPECKRIYHVKTMPPVKEGICDDCGAVLMTRKDDEEEAIRNRLLAYRDQTGPLVEYYTKRKRLLTINASGTPERVFTDFIRILNPETGIPNL